jgi:hypothetical protein
MYIAFQINDFRILENNLLNKLLAFLIMPYFFFNLFFRRKMLYKKY